jgi:hypothetical protein
MKLPEHERLQMVRVLKAFFKNPVQKTGELFNQSRNQLSILTGLLRGHCHFKGHPFKLRLVNHSKCDRCKQPSETACEALATLRLGHQAHNFLLSGDIEDICVSKILHFVQSVGLLKE